MDKQMIKYVSILVGLIVLLIIFLLLKNSFTGGVKYSYEDIETKMTTAAKKYVEDKKKNNQDVLPDAVGTNYEISSTILVNDGYINELSSYAKGDVICNGNVEVWNAGNGNYDYVPYLKCGSVYETTKLVSKVLEDNDFGVTYGSGLYQRKDGKFVTDDSGLGGSSDSFEYVFRGDDVKNYVQIDENIWRIVAIDGEDNMLLLLDNHSQKAYPWDEKYNEEINKYQGVNIYEENGLESNAYKIVRDFYDGNLNLMNKEKYSSKTRHILVPMDLCIGGRSEKDTSIDGSSECKKVLEGEYMGLLPAYYYMSASLDTSCTEITSKSCGNYNYMSSFGDYWWLLTANSDTTNEAYSVSVKYATSNICSYKADIRPIIKIGSRVVYSEGNGTLENPYKIKYFTEEN